MNQGAECDGLKRLENSFKALCPAVPPCGRARYCNRVLKQVPNWEGEVEESAATIRTKPKERCLRASFINSFLALMETGASFMKGKHHRCRSCLKH